jgi:hypothetical protein
MQDHSSEGHTVSSNSRAISEELVQEPYQHIFQTVLVPEKPNVDLEFYQINGQKSVIIEWSKLLSSACNKFFLTPVPSGHSSRKGRQEDLKALVAP